MKSFARLFLPLSLILSFLLLLSAGAMGQSGQKHGEAIDAYPSTSNWYKGMVSYDRDGNGEEDLVCDFGNIGIWHREAGLSWAKANSHNPDWMISYEYGSNAYLLADFGSMGLWFATGSGQSFTWQKLNNHDAQSGFALDDDDDGHDEIYIVFWGIGLWRYDFDTSSWNRLNKREASSHFKSDLWFVGHEEGNFSFPGIGLWSVFTNPYTQESVWTKLHNDTSGGRNASADFVGTGSGPDQLVVDFESNGLWLYDGSDWHQISSMAPSYIKPIKFMESADYELLVDFIADSALYWWNYNGYPGDLNKINNHEPQNDAGCESYDPDWDIEAMDDNEVAVDFGSVGLWQFDYSPSQSWTKLNKKSPESMLAIDYYGDGDKSCIVCDFGSGVGLWLWDGWKGTWLKLNNHNVDQ